MRVLFLEDAPLVKYGIGLSMKEKGITTMFTQLYRDINNKESKSLEKTIKEFKPDVIFNEGMCILENEDILFSMLKKYNLRYIYWAIEDPVDFKTLSIRHALKADITMTTCVECISHYKKYGINAMFMMFGCNKHFHKKGRYNPKFDHDIIFVGNNYSRHKTRNYGNQIMLKPLIENNFDIKIYGNNWWIDPKQKFVLDERFYGGFCSYEEIPQAYATAKIILGLHSVGNSSTMMSMRTSEVLGCGGFYLSQYVPPLEEYFVNKKHLVWCKNSDDTLKYVRYYLKNKEEREKIALEGQKECYLNHEYKDKVEELIVEMKERNIWKE